MKIKIGLPEKHKIEILGVLLIAVSFLVLVSLLTYNTEHDLQILKQLGSASGFFKAFQSSVENQAGIFGAIISFILFLILGYASVLLPIYGILWGSKLLFKLSVSRFLANILFLFLFLVLLGLVLNLSDLSQGAGFQPTQLTLGGWASYLFAKIFLKIFGLTGAYTLGITLLILVAFVASPVKISDLWNYLRSLITRLALKWQTWREDRKDKEAVKRRILRKISKGESTASTSPEYGTQSPSRVYADSDLEGRSEAGYKSTLKFVRGQEGEFVFPNLDLLDDAPSSKPTVSQDELNQTAKALNETLATFGIDIEEDRIEKHPGPVITRFEFKPVAGIKVNQVVSLADDLALALQAKRIRIVAPIPGKAAIGVEIPNRNPQRVYLKEILSSNLFRETKYRLALALGKTISGEPFIADLARMPHLLIAGSTGSGKSVCLNVIITSLLYRLHPEEIRFIFIDPKMLELSIYDGIPHLEKPVVTSSKIAEKILNDIVLEMENRYRKLARAGVRNIEDFNLKRKELLPYVIIIVDELADLMMSGSTRTEALITRLAQMARAVGIHLILATQRPSVDVITGLIKANFSSRVAFQVASKVDSRTILDTNGAEKLLGSGDMLFLSTGHPEPQRIHGAFISGEETQKVVEFLKSQNYLPAPIEALNKEETSETLSGEQSEDDDLFHRAAEVVIRHKQGSVSLLQRKLGIGYQRAARLIDQLEEAGVVGAYDGSKAREVLVDKMDDVKNKVSKRNPNL